ncbi:MAG: NDP-sugar synthase [Chitinophagales bacterium]
MKAMILAAGLGTRFKPWTDHHPKALAMINGKTLLQRNIEWLSKYGIRSIIVNLHHFADQILDAVKQNHGWGADIQFSDETDRLLETGGGLRKASWFFGHDSFLLLNVDILTDLNLSDFINHHQKNKCLATLAVTNRTSSRYFLFDEKNRLCGWRNVKTGVEKGPILNYQPADKKLVVQKAFSGIHMISPSIFSLIRREGKFSMVDLYLDLAASEWIGGFDHSGSKLVDVGKPESVAEAEALFP